MTGSRRRFASHRALVSTLGRTVTATSGQRGQQVLDRREPRLQRCDVRAGGVLLGRSVHDDQLAVGLQGATISAAACSVPRPLDHIAGMPQDKVYRCARRGPRHGGAGESQAVNEPVIDDAAGPGQDTTAALHRIADGVGTILLAASIRRNRWWNVPFHLTGRGIITSDWANRRPCHRRLRLR
jgi:uncharacterized protein DUF5996